MFPNAVNGHMPFTAPPRYSNNTTVMRTTTTAAVPSVKKRTHNDNTTSTNRSNNNNIPRTPFNDIDLYTTSSLEHKRVTSVINSQNGDSSSGGSQQHSTSTTSQSRGGLKAWFRSKSQKITRHYHSHFARLRLLSSTDQQHSHPHHHLPHSHPSHCQSSSSTSSSSSSTAIQQEANDENKIEVKPRIIIFSKRTRAWSFQPPPRMERISEECDDSILSHTVGSLHSDPTPLLSETSLLAPEKEVDEDDVLISCTTSCTISPINSQNNIQQESSATPTTASESND